ncbi:MAG: hypothetical protein HQL91_09455 [Magnetococcales bacterium]|nr:hypothetical protein [Magnetococcales bacterium]
MQRAISAPYDIKEEQIIMTTTIALSDRSETLIRTYLSHYQSIDTLIETAIALLAETECQDPQIRQELLESLTDGQPIIQMDMAAWRQEIDAKLLHQQAAVA